MDTLPQELVDFIIDYLFDDSSALKACCLVRRQWLMPSRYHLFSCISLDPSISLPMDPGQSISHEVAPLLESFMSFINSAPECSFYIRKLRLGTALSRTAILISQSEFHKFYCITKRLSSLRSIHLLSLTFDSNDLEGKSSTLVVSDAVVQPIRKLAIISCHMSAASDIGQLVLLYPAEKLVIEDIDFIHRASGTLEAEGIPSFRIDDASRTTSLYLAIPWPLEDLMLILNNITRHLTTLNVSLWNIDGIEPLGRFVRDRASTLTQLCLGFHSADMKRYSTRENPLFLWHPFLLIDHTVDEVHNILVPMISLDKCTALRSLQVCIEACQNQVAQDTEQQWCLLSGILSTIPAHISRGLEVTMKLHIAQNNASGATRLQSLPLCWSEIDSIVVQSLGLQKLVFMGETIGYSESRGKEETTKILAEDYQNLIISRLPHVAASGILVFGPWV